MWTTANDLNTMRTYRFHCFYHNVCIVMQNHHQHQCQTPSVFPFLVYRDRPPRTIACAKTKSSCATIYRKPNTAKSTAPPQDLHLWWSDIYSSLSNDGGIGAINTGKSANSLFAGKLNRRYAQRVVCGDCQHCCTPVSRCHIQVMISRTYQ